MDTIAGLVSGNQWKSALCTIEVGVPDTVGEKITRTTEQISPPYIVHSVPVVLYRGHSTDSSIVEVFVDAATAKARMARNATFCPVARIPPMIDSIPITSAVSLATHTSE